MTEQQPTLGVGMIGYAFMGAVHSQAWRSAHRFFDLPLEPRMRVVCGRDGARVAEAAVRMGWDESATSWQDVIGRDDIDLVDVCTPGDTHAEIAIAAASPTGGSPRSGWPAGWSPTTGWVRSGTCARSTSRTGSSTRTHRSRGGWTRPGPAPGRSATSARTWST